jgi:hypothetical protein
MGGIHLTSEGHTKNQNSRKFVWCVCDDPSRGITKVTSRPEAAASISACSQDEDLKGLTYFMSYNTLKACAKYPCNILAMHASPPFVSLPRVPFAPDINDDTF